MQRSSRITFSVTPEVYEQLRQIAYARHISISRLIRETIESISGLLGGTLPPERAGGKPVISDKDPAATHATAHSPLLPSDEKSVAKTDIRQLCSKRGWHHIYHSGKPCPECGYPTP